MIPLVGIPDFVHKYAQEYEDLLSEALMEHFERYLTGIYVCERRNVQAINDSFAVDIKNQSSLNRFLTEYKWSYEKLNERRLKLFHR